MRLVAKLQLEKKGRQDQCAHHENRNPDHNIESIQWQQQSVARRGKELPGCDRGLWPCYLEPGAAFDEARESRRQCNDGDQAPICHPRSIRSRTDRCPQQGCHDAADCLRRSNKGCPSIKVAPPSSGRPNVPPRTFLARTAVPLATISRISSCSTNQPCINRASCRASDPQRVHAKEELLSFTEKLWAGICKPRLRAVRRRVSRSNRGRSWRVDQLHS